MADGMPDYLKAKEKELRTTIGSAWVFSVGAAFFALGSLAGMFLLDLHSGMDWVTIFVAVVMLLFFGFIAVVSWNTVRFNTYSLMMSKQAEADAAASQQKGVWPPPPSGPKR